MTELFLLASDFSAKSSVTEILPTDGGTWSTVTIVAFVVGVVITQLVAWMKGWMDGKGKEWFAEQMIGLQSKINENSVMSQIQADDAVLKIIEACIPEILLELVDTAKQDLADGKFDKVNWSNLGEKLWAKAKPQIVGGANDYIKNSSFQDGKAVAEWVLKRFFAKKITGA